MEKINSKKEFVKDMLFSALILGVLLVLFVILNFSLTLNSWVATAIQFVLCFAIPFYMGKEFKKKLTPSDRFPFGKAFLFAFLVIMIGGVIGSIGNVAYNAYIGYDAIIARGIQAIEQTGQSVVQAQIDFMTKMVTNPFLAFGSSFLSYLCPAVIVSPIVAALINKKENEVVADLEEE